MAETNLSSGDKGGHAGASETHTAPGVTDKVAALTAKAKETVSATVEKTKDMPEGACATNGKGGSYN